MDGKRPVLLLTGDFEIRGDQNSSMELNGLMVAGGAVAAPAHYNANPNLLTTLTISHCTLAPPLTPLEAHQLKWKLWSRPSIPKLRI